jgi:thiol-disulfide isomerase/thioredoxin
MDQVSLPQRVVSGWRRLRQQRWTSWLIDGAIIAALLVGVGAWQNRNLPEGTPPPLSLATLDGGRLGLDDFKGTPTLVVFWAPWCGVCAAEADNLARVQSLVGDRARVVTVAAEYERLDEVEKYVARHEIALPVLLGGKRTARDWRVSAFPTAFVLDEDGQISHRMVGYTSTLGMLVRLLLA